MRTETLSSIAGLPRNASVALSLGGIVGGACSGIGLAALLVADIPVSGDGGQVSGVMATSAAISFAALPICLVCWQVAIHLVGWAMWLVLAAARAQTRLAFALTGGALAALTPMVMALRTADAKAWAYVLVFFVSGALAGWTIRRVADFSPPPAEKAPA